MNPLRQDQIKTLKKLNCEDLDRKIQEIIDHINDEEMPEELIINGIKYTKK